MKAKFIYEKFEEDSDPIHDMRIGVRHLQEEWLDNVSKKLHDRGYVTLGECVFLKSGKINVIGNLCLPDNCGNLPDYIQFYKVTGDVLVMSCNLTSLKGMPEIVHGGFRCQHNNLTSLRYCPKKVGGDFLCFQNNKRFTKGDVQKLCKVNESKIFV